MYGYLNAQDLVESLSKDELIELAKVVTARLKLFRDMPTPKTYHIDEARQAQNQGLSGFVRLITMYRKDHPVYSLKTAKSYLEGYKKFLS